MGAIHVHEFMSLDGVIDAPTWTFDYGFRPEDGRGDRRVHGRCRASCSAHDLRDVRAGVVDADGEGRSRAPFFNDTTKYVVSATLTTATWRNSKIVGPYDPDTIRNLKDEVDGDLYVSGSVTLVRAMLADGLVDELHLFVYPLTRGSGPRLFPEDAAPPSCRLRPVSRTRTVWSTWSPAAGVRPPRSRSD